MPPDPQDPQDPRTPSPPDPGTPGPPDPASAPPPQPPAQVSVQQARTWGMLCHLSSFAGYLTGAGFVAGPLIVWLVKRAEFPFADHQRKEALNFNLSLFIYVAVSVVLGFTIIGLVIAIPALIAIWLGHLVFTIVAAVKASNGVPYRYPLTIRLIQ